MSLKTIKSESRSQYVDRGSKFNALLKPIESFSDFKLNLKSIRLENPKSSHVCSACRIFSSNFIQERASDDGEPAGSAGQPILNELKRNSIVNAGVFIVRYYGGTKLGIPGLIHSYSEATKLSVLNNRILDWRLMHKYNLIHSYRNTNLIDSILKKYKATLLKRDFDLFVNSYIEISQDLSKSFQRDIQDKISDSISIKKIE